MEPNNLESAGPGFVGVDERDRNAEREPPLSDLPDENEDQSVPLKKNPNVVLICSCSAAALFYHVPVSGMRPCWPCLAVMHHKCVDLRCV